MAFHNSLWVLMAIFLTFMSSSHAKTFESKTFEVGGKDGWTLHPSQNYNNWSGRLRFLINDTLHFKYDGATDSVLVVNKGDYDGCNTDKPITKLDGGDSSFKLDRSGPFYFISGNKSNCDQGQKLIVVVLAPRIRSPPPSTATPPAPAVSPVVPPSPSTISPVSPSPSSVSPGAPTPAGMSPSSSPSGAPDLTPPASSPSGGNAPSPGGGGASSPGGGGGASSPGGGGGASSPGGGGGASSPGGGGASSPGGAGGGQAPGGGNPAADVNTPPRGSAAPRVVSGIQTASFVTMILALWWFN